MKSEDGFGNFPSERFEFPNRNDVLNSESSKFMQILDLEAFSVPRICTLSLRVPERGFLKVYGTLFFDPPFLWSEMVKKYFFTIENPFRGLFLAQQYPKRPV